MCAKTIHVPFVMCVAGLCTPLKTILSLYYTSPFASEWNIWRVKIPTIQYMYLPLLRLPRLVAPVPKGIYIFKPSHCGWLVARASPCARDDSTPGLVKPLTH